MSAATATHTRPSIGWLLGMSSWMLLTLIPGAATTWLAFGIVGVISRRVRVIVLGVVFAGAAIVASLNIWGPWRSVAIACVYLAGMIVALAVNPGWLRSMWERRAARGSATAARSRGAAGRGSSSRQGSASGAGRKPSRSAAAEKRAAATREADARADRDRDAADARAGRDHDAADAGDTGVDEAASLAAQVGARTDDLIAPSDAAGAGSADATPSALEPVDVNTADAEALRSLPGVSRARARAAVRARDEQGGFVSVEAFGEAIGLQPHEIVRLRGVATCSPRPRGERRFGRRVDL